MNEDNNSKAAKHLGKGLAKLQAFADDVLTAGFQALKKTGKKKREIDTTTPKGKIVSALSKTASFLGEAGNTFYHEYEKIKANKLKKK